MILFVTNFTNYHELYFKIIVKGAIGSNHFVGLDFNPVDKEIPQCKTIIDYIILLNWIEIQPYKMDRPYGTFL
ncbi:hypothetical protein [Flavobacterium cutihirudinis]|uniref:hypothetical protein n=1 Tax=Flavobacterium cutihirudinis TaxID=1265740 RepID=UPI0011C01B52|nr:hypothetical protein [Flavobacterium cutihirudinis]